MILWIASAWGQDEEIEGAEEVEAEEELPAEPMSDLPDPYPLFVRPFDGEYRVANFFDHGDTPRNQQRAVSGAVVDGITGHVGYDFGMPEGTPLFAVADATVLRGGDREPTPCRSGKVPKRAVEVILVTDPLPDGTHLVVQYMHLDEAAVRPGERVQAGQVIGRSGNTGCSSGPHLHFEVVRVRDPERAKGVSVDPYGWRGEGRDPRVVRGRPANVWLWKEGEAPPLVRAVRAKTPPDPVAPVRLVAVDGVQPLAGEYVDLGAAPDLRRPIKLKGWSLRNEGGEVVPLPTVRIPPGEELRVWTSRPDPGEGEISLDRSAPLWEDNRDCAALLDPQGQIVGALPHGRRNKQCTGWGG